MPTSVKKRSVVVAGHRTSVSLERAFWDALRVIAARRKTTINQLVSEIDAARSGNLSSAIRVFVLRSVMERGAGQPADSASVPRSLPRHDPKDERVTSSS